MTMQDFVESSQSRKLRDDERLALFLPSLRGGGAERVMLTLANSLSMLGYNVDLVLAKAQGPYLIDVSPNVSIVDLNASRVIKSLPGLTSYLRRERPVALLSAMGHANVIAGISRMLARVPTRLVVSEHNNLSVPKPDGARMAERVLLQLMRRMYRKADCVVAVSSGVADSVALTIGYPRALIEVIYNPIVNNAMLARSREDIDHRWLRHPEVPVVIGVGRLVAQKDFAVLIRAIAHLRERLDVRLIILGEGELRPELEKLIHDLGLSEFVDMPGFVSNPYAYLYRASVFALSSRWEGLPSVMIEAMAFGASVVSTDCPSGPAEILQHGKFGALVPVGDVLALTDAIHASLKNPKPSIDVSTRASEFGVDNAVRHYLSILIPER